MHYYSVLTYPGGVPQSVIDALIIYAKRFSKYIIITEKGSKGTFLHVNFIYLVPDNLDKYWIGNNKKNFCPLYYPHDISIWNKHTVLTKRAYTPENVIGGYMQKEIDAEFLVNVGFDIEAMKVQALANLPPPKPTPITLKNAHHKFYDYFNIEHISEYQCLTFREFTDIISHDLRLSDVWVPFVPRLKQIYQVYEVVYQNQMLDL